MSEKEIQEGFEKLGIAKTDLPEYVNPYIFSKKLLERREDENEVICYSNSTQLPAYNTYHA